MSNLQILPLSKKPQQYYNYRVIMNSGAFITIQAEDIMCIEDADGAITLFNFVKKQKVVAIMDATEVRCILSEETCLVQECTEALIPMVKKRTRR